MNHYEFLLPLPSPFSVRQGISASNQLDNHFQCDHHKHYFLILPRERTMNHRLLPVYLLPNIYPNFQQIHHLFHRFENVLDRKRFFFK